MIAKRKGLAIGRTKLNLTCPHFILDVTYLSNNSSNPRIRVEEVQYRTAQPDSWPLPTNRLSMVAQTILNKRKCNGQGATGKCLEIQVERQMRRTFSSDKIAFTSPKIDRFRIEFQSLPLLRLPYSWWSPVLCRSKITHQALARDGE